MVTESVFSIAVLLSSAFVVLITPVACKRVKKFMKARGICGVDIHKPEKPLIPEMGGLAFIPILIFLSLLFWFVTGNIAYLYVALITAMFFFYGVLDDLLRLGKYAKLIITLAISGVASILTLAFYDIEFSLLVMLLFILICTAVGNAINIFAGFNGLESGSTLLVLFFTLVYCLLVQASHDFLIFLIFSIITIFFFYLENKYPAKIFPGDCGTLGMGGFLVGLILFFDLTPILLFLSLHFADMLMKGLSARGYFSSSEKPKSKVRKDGVLIPGKGYLSIAKAFMYVFHVNEKTLVKMLLSLQFCVCIIALGLKLLLG